MQRFFGVFFIPQKRWTFPAAAAVNVSYLYGCIPALFILACVLYSASWSILYCSVKSVNLLVADSLRASLGSSHVPKNIGGLNLWPLDHNLLRTFVEEVIPHFFCSFVSLFFFLFKELFGIVGHLKMKGGSHKNSCTGSINASSCCCRYASMCSIPSVLLCVFDIWVQPYGRHNYISAWTGCWADTYFSYLSGWKLVVSSSPSFYVFIFEKLFGAICSIAFTPIQLWDLTPKPEKLSVNSQKLWVGPGGGASDDGYSRLKLPVFFFFRTWTSHYCLDSSMFHLETKGSPRHKNSRAYTLLAVR